MPANAIEAPEIEVPEHVVKGAGVSAPEPSPALSDPVVQSSRGERAMPDPELTFEGLSNDDNQRIVGLRPTPPDTNGDVGPNHYVQTVNLIFAVYDREGNLLLGPLPNNALWAGFGGPCEVRNNGDPIVLYDQLADRWLLSQFTTSPFRQCIAISQTGDPTGAWHRYEFPITSGVFNDYPKFGVWPDAYYMSARARGLPPGPPSEAFAFERDQMLAGAPAQVVSFVGLPSIGYVGWQPSDLDGPPPPPGTPNYFVGVKVSVPQALLLFQFHVDWSDPASSTFGINGFPNATLSDVAPLVLICPGTRSCIPQPDTTVRIDALAGRYVMYRTQYRNFGTHETIVFNHTVDAGGQRAGVRWYEIRDPGGAPVIHQQSTYAPDDGVNRWMGSAAMDRQGNLAIGFSVSSSMVYPGIHYAGRLTTDPLGELTQSEAVMQLGGGSQLSAGSRWGDYSMMAVDPTDDCTFWYTTEYYAVTSSNGWQTRIGRFRFPGCRPEPDFALSANPEFLEIPQGGSDTSTITVASLNDFAGDVNLTCEGQQPGVTCSFRPNPVTVLAGSSATSILTLSVAPEVPVGDDSVMVKGTDAAGNMRMVAIDYRVTPGITPSFDITCTPSSFPVFFGVSAGVSQCRIASQGGFQGFVDLSCSGAGVTCLFLPDPVRVPAGGVGTGGLVMIAFGVQPGDVFHVVGRSGTLTDTFTMTFRRP